MPNDTVTKDELEKLSVFQNLCDRCARKMLHPPITIPNSRAVPLKHRLGSYAIPSSIEVCHLCAAEMLAEDGEFQQDVLDRNFEPLLRWDIIIDENGDQTLMLREADDPGSTD